ncbi:MAG TPA: glycoside hydrolase family 3 C-terminal domain-containing protein [Steroidobacteraceae bacterium]|nr:glycoside hydrolase family 3 C-terminal domain-containing protein [Steroidobacteraceae bacterium]
MRIPSAIGVAAALALIAGCRAFGPHAQSDTRVDALLARMTLDEKIELLHGAPEPPSSSQGEAGYLPGIARLGIAPLRFADGPPGVLTRYRATGLTASMGLAATFSREDARANGSVIARDAGALGIDVVLEPFINIHRDQSFFRAYNTFGEDPLLTAEIASSQIAGIQAEGIMAMAKHYIAYDGATNVSVDPQTLHEIYLAPFAAAVAAQVSAIMCSYNVINGRYACGNPDTLETMLRGELNFRGFVTSDWGAVHATDFINDGLDLEMPGSGTAADSYLAADLPRQDQPRIALDPPVINHIPEETPPEPMPAPRLAGSRPIGLHAALERGIVDERTITQAARYVLLQMQRFGRLEQALPGGVPTGIESPQAIAQDAAVVYRTALDAAVLLKNDAAALPLRAEDLSALALIGPGALQDIAIGESGEKALGRVERQIGPGAALREAADVGMTEAVADDMTGTPVPDTQLAHDGEGGLLRLDAEGRTIATDAALDFTLTRGNPLPAGTSAQWRGVLRVPQSGRYRLYLQILGARGSLAVDGRSIAATGGLSLHGDVLQPGQDNVLPTRDGLDNVRRELALDAGDHALSVHVYGETHGQSVQVRLAWLTPAQRSADYAQALRVASAAHTAIVFAWSRGRPVFHLPGDQDRLIADIAAANPNTIVVMNISEPVAMPWLDRVKAVLLMWWPGDEGGRASADLLLGRVSPGGRLPFTWPLRLEDGPANDPAHPERSSLGLNGLTTYSEGIYVGYRWFDDRHIEPLFPFGFGLSYTRFDYADLAVRQAADGGLDVSFTLHNSGSGSGAGDEVPQLYLGAPDARPAGVQFANRALAAFERVHLEAGEARRVTLHVAARALQYWSSPQRRWLTADGSRRLYVGASSRDLRLQALTRIAAH